MAPLVLSLLVSSLILLAPRSTLAQGVQTGTLRGAVVDAQGLPVPGVVVTVTSPALQGQSETDTGRDGAFVLPALPPGSYEATFAISGFAPERRTVLVPLGESVGLTVTLQPAAVKTQVTVVATPAPLVDASGGLNVPVSLVGALPLSRSIRGLATEAPGVTERTPQGNQISIHGAFGYDNLFMLNGVDINDNVSGAPQEIFIEEAIQETQVLTSGISAEYGRFSGGVVNAITQSGGNRFAGSIRVNFTSPSWTDETPFEDDNGVERADTLNEFYEMTLGGPILRDRLWFFGAGRRFSRENSLVLDVTGIPYTAKNEDTRVEGKLTATIAPSQTLQGGFFSTRLEIGNQAALLGSIDPATLTTQRQPNWYVFGNYRGAFAGRLLAEAQVSTREWTSEFAERTGTGIVDAPFLSADDFLFYNGPYFDPSDPEERNNRQLTGNLTYVADTYGQHEIKGGYEWYRSQNVGGNSQSPSGFVFIANYLTDDDGNPVLDADGRFIPLFEPGVSQVENWRAERGARLNIDTTTLFARDHWRVNKYVSADVGFRYERARSEATGGLVGVDTDTWLPRLAVAVDPTGQGFLSLHATYGHYAGRYNENLIGENTLVANPAQTFGVYIGPPGQGRDFAEGFNPANYETVFGIFPTINVLFDEDLSAPVTKEFTTSVGAALGDRAYATATYVWRDMTNLIEDFVEAANGSVDVEADGVPIGTFTNRVYRNTDAARRRYQAAVFQGRYNVRSNWSAHAAWTIQLENDGNYEGESPDEPAATSPIGNFPQILSAARHFPDGRLATFQRHRARVWSIYDVDLGRRGQLSFSGLWRFESGRPYSLVARSEALTETQDLLLIDAGYPDFPDGQDIYFGERGANTFPSHGLLDLSVNYAIPVLGPLRPWVKADLFNVFNNQKLVGWDTTVNPDPDSPVDALGLPTGYIEGPRFGEPRGSGDYPRSLGVDGGRTFRLAVALRF